MPLALMLAVAVMMGVAFLACSIVANRCVDISGLPWYLGGAVLGIILAAAYWVRAFRLGDQIRRRLILDGVVLMLGVAPYVLAWTSDRITESKALKGRHPAAPSIAK